MSAEILDYYPRPETETRYCAACYYHDSNATASIYVLCDTSSQALSKAEELFFSMAKESRLLMRKIRRIEILPKNAGRWDNVNPILHRDYEI